MPTLKLHYDGWLMLPVALRQALDLNSGVNRAGFAGGSNP
jgi:hypothetical protein